MLYFLLTIFQATLLYELPYKHHRVVFADQSPITSKIDFSFLVFIFLGVEHLIYLNLRPQRMTIFCFHLLKKRSLDVVGLIFAGVEAEFMVVMEMVRKKWNSYCRLKYINTSGLITFGLERPFLDQSGIGLKK